MGGLKLGTAWREVVPVKPLPTEQQWKLIRHLFPPPAPTGRTQADDWKVLEDILSSLAQGGLQCKRLLRQLWWRKETPW